jgi:C4-type Zn-finger protein
MSFKIGSEPLNQDSISLLRNTLQKYSGDKTFTITIQTPDAASVIITPEERISFASALIEELEELFPDQTLEFGYSSIKKYHC